MFKLEHSTVDIDKAKTAGPILVKLHNKQDAKWNDDFAANSLLRQQLRVSLKANQIHCDAMQSTILHLPECLCIILFDFWFFAFFSGEPLIKSQTNHTY